MNREELLKRIRTIELTSKALSRDIHAGQYKTAFKGRGMSFAEVRDYQYGDEIRAIDWNVTARYNTPYVKVFEEERELTVMLMVDISGSFYYGKEHLTKLEKAIEFFATIAFSALLNNDKIGAVFYTDEVESYIPPKKGREHIMLMLDKLICAKPVKKGTSLGAPLRTLRQTQKKRTISFLISDFRDASVNLEELYLTKKYHDLIAVKINDPSEEAFTYPGFYQVLNPETGEKQWVNGFSAFAKRLFSKDYAQHHETISNNLKAKGIPLISLSTQSDIIKPLTHFFKHRK